MEEWLTPLQRSLVMEAILHQPPKKRKCCGCITGRSPSSVGPSSGHSQPLSVAQEGLHFDRKPKHTQTSYMRIQAGASLSTALLLENSFSPNIIHLCQYLIHLVSCPTRRMARSLTGPWELCAQGGLTWICGLLCHLRSAVIQLRKLERPQTRQTRCGFRT